MRSADDPARLPRVAFAGTPEFAARALSALLEHGFEVPLVLTQPDRPAGRGMKLQPSAVKSLAALHRLEVVQPHGLRLDGKFSEDAALARDALLRADPDVMVVAAYGLILPSWVLELPRRGCLNIHASLLPRWRGAAPIHRAIEAGDRQTGITLMQMDAGLDTGAMLRTACMPITDFDTTASLHDRLAAMGAELTVAALRELDGLVSTPQPQDGVTYAHKIEKAEAWIDWGQPAVEIERRIRAFDPFPGAITAWGGETLKIWRAACVPGPGLAPGAVVASGPQELVVACGDGAVKLLEVQKPGGKRIPIGHFLQSHPPLPDTAAGNQAPSLA